MPELPEVETTLRALAPRLVGRTITAVTVYDGRLRWPVPSDLAQRLCGQPLRSLSRRARYLLFGFDQGTLLVHFGMTGTLRCVSSPQPRAAHEQLRWVLDSGEMLRYCDPRRFGAVLWTDDPPERHPLLAGLGPEPLGPDFGAAGFHRAVHRRRVAAKLAVMDNTVVCGVGNIYANEALFRARLRPSRRCDRLSHADCARLVVAVREVLSEAIAAGGSTLRDYFDSDGRPGYFQLEHRVYGRRGLPCMICGTVIREMRLGGRASCYCPRCQK